ncbi:MAG TPA: M14 family zinc carboxypeptidase [Solirubrobacter sp.]|nr:M14 family zinc carboxypeptidase [Solirubrobacter sp.]
MASLAVFAAPASAGEGHGHDSGYALNPSEALVEVIAKDRFQVDELVNANVDLAEYLRENDDGTITLNAYLTDAEMAKLEQQGFKIGATIEDADTANAAIAEREATLAAEERSAKLAELGSERAGGNEGRGASLAPPEVLPEAAVAIGRADYFVNYAGRFLSVEAKRPGTSTGSTPTLSVSWRAEDGTYGSSTSMSQFNDGGQYMYHRTLIRIGAAGSTTPVPAFVRVASSAGGVNEKAVKSFPVNQLPPFPEGMLTGFFNAYMDPSQATQRIEDLSTEFGGANGIAEIVELPNKTHGLGWPTAIMNGTGGIGTAPSGTAGAQSVVLYSKTPSPAGEQTRVQFRNPGAADAPLTVTVTADNALGGSDIVVDLATGATGALTSTAAQVVAAINAHAGASALVNATTYPTSQAGTGVVQPRALIALSDFITAPAHYRLGPFTQKMIRIGKHRDGSKTGVYLFCQQHAREWVTPITCIETAERLLRNYGTDPLTTELVDNLDIFILPSANPDGGGLSILNTQGGSGGLSNKRTNMANHCSPTSATFAPTSANVLSQRGVDINRNFPSGNGAAGYSGSSTSCNGETNRGPEPLSEPEAKNDAWIVDTFPNIKFSNNIHTYGGYFMWSPGAYTSAGRVTLPAPNIGVEGYFFKAADTIIERISQYRGSVVLPQRTGPIADVLYSAAGNTADDHWYRKGIIAYSFEAGSDRFSSTTSGTSQSAVGFQPAFATEGRHEAMEFANGNYGLMEAALEYSRDTEKPVAKMTNVGASNAPIDTTFEWVNEPSVIHYTTDGSTPTLDSPAWNADAPRQPGQRFRITETSTFKWIAKDMKGNVSDVQEARFVIDTAAPTVTITTPADGASFLQGDVVHAEYTCADDDAVASCAGSVAAGSALDTAEPGVKSLTVTARDAAGNETVVTREYTVNPAVRADGNVGGTVSGTLSLVLGASPSFGTFTPGIAQTYTASTTANVISTAGDATLSVADPSAVGTGHLVNGAFVLPKPLKVGGSALPAVVKSYSGPVSNDAATVAFTQEIAADDALRTGTYSKTLTFTLSTSTP